MILQRGMGRLATGLAVVVITWLIATPTWSVGTQGPVNKGPINIEEKWGVQIVGIRLTAAGHMLDFRYKVIDPKKAAPILNRKNRPRLIDQASKKALSIKALPKIGRLRQNTLKPMKGRVYFMIFPNPGLVKAHSRVTVEVGDFRAENLVVEE